MLRQELTPLFIRRRGLPKRTEDNVVYIDISTLSVWVHTYIDIYLCIIIDSHIYRMLIYNNNTLIILYVIT